MKKIIIMKALILLFAAVTVCCEGDDALRVLVLPCGDIPGEARTSAQDLNDIVRKEVARSKKYEYVSADELAEKWFEGKKDAVGDLIMSAGLHSPDLGSIGEKQKLFRVDLILVNIVKKEGESLKLESRILGIEDGKSFSINEEVKPDDIDAAMDRNTALMLDKAGAVMKVAADKITDSVESTVSYYITTLDGGSVELRIDYESERPDPQMMNAQFIPTVTAAQTLSYKISTVEGKEIEIKFRYDKGQLSDVSVTTEPDRVSNKIATERLSMVSRGGYTIYFYFQWDGKNLQKVWVEPALNPYGEVK